MCLRAFPRGRRGAIRFIEDTSLPKQLCACWQVAACTVASVEVPAVSDVAASANIHTAPLRRNANDADTNSRLLAIIAIFEAT